MLKKIYSVYLLAVTFLVRNYFVLIPFYFINLSSWFWRREERVHILLVPVSLLAVYFIVIAIREREEKANKNLGGWKNAIADFIHILFILLYLFLGMIVGGFAVGFLSMFASEAIYKTLLFFLSTIAMISLLFGVFVILFFDDSTSLEAIVLGTRIFFSNLLFFLSIFLTEVLIMVLVLLLRTWMKVDAFYFIIGPILISLEVASFTFAFLQAAKSWDNTKVAWVINS